MNFTGCKSALGVWYAEAKTGRLLLNADYDAVGGLTDFREHLIDEQHSRQQAQGSTAPRVLEQPVQHNEIGGFAGAGDLGIR